MPVSFAATASRTISETLERAQLGYAAHGRKLEGWHERIGKAL